MKKKINILKNIDGKEINKIQLKENGEMTFNFNKNNNELSFCLEREELYDIKNIERKLFEIEGFPPNYVLAYIDDDSIAQINQNSIYGLKKGETKLNLAIDNYVFVYEIKVK